MSVFESRQHTKRTLFSIAALEVGQYVIDSDVFQEGPGMFLRTRRDVKPDEVARQMNPFWLRSLVDARLADGRWSPF